MTLFAPEETIVAPASPPGAGLRGILRLSGPAVGIDLLSLFRPADPERWKNASLPIVHPGHFLITDDFSIPVEVGYWPSHRSYSGQPMAEIYTVAAQPLLEQMLSRLNEVGIRTAERGEFTFRAFLHGRVDLVQAEAVLGVIDSNSEAELQTALDQLAGGISQRMMNVRRDLLELLADLEAGLDFVDEDIQFVSQSEIRNRLADASHAVEELIRNAESRLRSESRLKIVLAGLPNAGKSTLLNALAQQDAAIVSEIAGTTRDYLSIECDIVGQKVLVIDTAGWEVSSDPVMQSAQQLRLQQISEAELVLWCSPGRLSDADQIVDREQSEVCRSRSREFALVQTKSDLVAQSRKDFELCISILSTPQESLAAIEKFLATKILQNESHECAMIGTTSSRCRKTLRETQRSLREAIEAAERAEGDELVAMELRAALDGLGVVLGVLHTDDLLDRIFSKFCIGK